MTHKHDDEFTDDELMAMQVGHMFNEAQRHVFADGGAVSDDDGKVHYQRIPIRRAVPHGGFRLPLDVLGKLSREHGPREIGVMLKKLFDVDPNDPQAVPAHAVAAHGGHKVLQRFIRHLRSGRAQQTK
jgi:hypothetical protein